MKNPLHRAGDFLWERLFLLGSASATASWHERHLLSSSDSFYMWGLFYACQ